MYLEKGFSAREIANQYGYSKAFVLDLLKTHGIDRRPPYDNGLKTAIPPYGFKDSNRGRVLDKEEQTIVNRIIDLRGKNHTLRSICHILDNEGRAARQDVKWHPQKIKRILDRIHTKE